MEGDAVLTEKKAREVIVAAGYKVVSFAEGAAPKVTAYRFRVKPLAPDARAKLEQGLREDVEAAERVAIDGLGRATVVLAPEAGDAREALLASLTKRGVVAEGFETKLWPKLDATYVVAVEGMRGSTDAQSVVDVLSEVPKVVAVHVDRDAGAVTLWLKEPCDALDAKVRAALEPTGLSVARFELVRAETAASASQ
jgi:hypothetical protein